MTIDDKTPNWPGDPQIFIKQLSTVENNSIAKKIIIFHSHFSTHIDAPAHMVTNGKTLSDYPIEKFIGTKIWDIAAPYLILKEAGAIVTDLFGNEISFRVNQENYADKISFMAANKEVHEKALGLAREIY